MSTPLPTSENPVKTSKKPKATNPPKTATPLKTSAAPAHLPGFGRIPITKVAPVIEGGSYPAKAVVGELVPIQAVVFREGHDGVCASVLLTSPNQVQTRIEMDAIEPVGLDPWLAFFTPDEIGLWTFKIEGWSDPWNTWLHNAHAKLAANIDVELVCLEGRALLEQTASKVDDSAVAKILEQAVTALNPQSTANQLLEVIDQESLQQVMGQHRPRELVSSTPNYPIFVDRKKSLFSAWYEFFPRSIGAVYNSKSESWTSGNFDTCHELLERIAGMGFDVVYLPPIHPIGMSYRKGKNNTLEPATSDPGSPWAIGAEAGGHDAIHPDLGDFAAFARFVKKTNDLGMEVALDLALQCSPDHPWVKTHPQWFTTRLDGTIAYAENPPKKYQDIYPLNFDNDPNGIYHEILNIVRFWMEHGVRIFRVDNPHTKPVRFWAWLIAEIRKTDPDVIFLAEAFTKPEMMHALGKVGFQQSYTYFTWRNAKWELTEYLNELSQESAAFFRPNFFVNTPDINPFFLQSGNPAAFAIRAILAATMSPSWGVYSGFEYFEHEPLRLGGEEYLNSEKYEYRPRDYDQENLCALLGKLNQIRTAHPALQQLRNITFHHVPHDQVIAFSKRVHDDTVFVICSLDATGTPESEVHVDYAALGFAQGQQLKLFDELTQVEFNWGEHNFVRLPPAAPAHILTVIR